MLSIAKIPENKIIKIMMNIEKNKSVCPVESAGALDSSVRRFLQNPKKIIEPYIKKGMTVLDMGCGSGFFSIEIANLLNGNGKVIAADLQEGMLEKLNKKIKGTILEQRIELHKCQEATIGVVEKVDFVLAFYMIHEMPDQNKLFEELKSILKPNGKIYIVEPKFHVPKKTFNKMIKTLNNNGFKIIDRPKVFFSRAVLIKISY